MSERSKGIHEIRDWVGLEIMHLLLIIKNKQQEIGEFKNILLSLN